MDAEARTQARLFILVLLAFLPAVGMYFYARATLEAHELAQREGEILQAANVAYGEYHQLLSESEHLLAALVEFPEIRDGKEPECNQRLSSVLRHVSQYTTFSLIGLDGYLACGSLTVDEGLYLGDRYYYSGALSTNRFTVGRYAVGRITGKPTVGVGYPISTPDGTQVKAVLAASIDLSTLAKSALEMSLPTGATFTILDRDGTVLVRIPEGRDPLGADSVGATAPETFPRVASVSREPYLLTGRDLDGVIRLFAGAPLRGHGVSAEGYLLVGLERAMLLQEIEAVSSKELRFLTIAGVLVLLLTWLFGHYALVRSAREE